MRVCTRCGATFTTTTLFCPRDGAAIVERPGDSAFSQGAAPPSDPLLGLMVGNFQLTRRIGAGGMGAVYEGLHPLVGIRVAVKILGGTLALDRELVDRFFAEARTLNQVAHENIVRVVDVGVHARGFYYCVMELLEGTTLAAVVANGRVELGRALELLAQAADALAAAHEKGIVHRDLKPANVMVVPHPATGADLVKLVDFGIAKLQSLPVDGYTTMSGTVMGTPAYMSPEQAAGRIGEIDARSDLYSLGIVAYELVTGRHPFESRPVGELLVAQITETPPSPGRLVPLPAALDDAIMRLLRKRREERFASAALVAHELRAIAAELTHAPAPVTELPPAEVRAPAPTPAPRRDATPHPSGRVRMANRRPASERKPVRPLFWLGLAAAGLALGAATTGLLNAEPIVAAVAGSMGLSPPTRWVARAAPPQLDGTNGAFTAAPAIEACREGLQRFRDASGDGGPDDPLMALETKARLLEALSNCLRSRSHGLGAEARWSPPYVEGVARFEMGLSLDRLPSEWHARARERALQGSGTPLLLAELYASQASERFDEARQDAPDAARAFIDNFQIEIDALQRRARAASTSRD